MIVCEGFLPLGWVHQAIYDALIDRFRKDWCSRPENLEHVRKVMERKTSEQSKEASLEVMSRMILKQEIDRIFWVSLQGFPIFLTHDGRQYRAAPELLSSIHQFSFEEEFWDLDLNDFDEYNLDLSLMRDWLKIPVFLDQILLFVDPFTWSVDPRPMSIVRRCVAETIDPIRFKAFLQVLENSADEVADCDGERYDLSSFTLARRLLDEGAIEEGEQISRFPSATLYEYFFEYTEPLLVNFGHKSVAKFEGATLSIRESDWHDFVRNKLPHFNYLGGADDVHSVGARGKREGSTVADEHRAFQFLSRFLEDEDWLGTQADLRRELPFSLGARAWQRVVRRLADDFPHVSSPGRRPSKS